MANTFKNYFLGAAGTSVANVYTVPSATQATVIGMSIANITSSPVTANVRVNDSGTGSNFFMLQGAVVATGGALVPIGGDQKLVLEAGDKLQVQMGSASAADVIVSVLEIS